MKGMELPINMIVVVLIAVLVLVTIGAFLAGQLGSGQTDIKMQALLSSACQKTISVGGCDLDATTMTLDQNYPGLGSAGLPVSLREICQARNLNADECLATCGCPRNP